jgi:integrase
MRLFTEKAKLTDGVIERAWKRRAAEQRLIIRDAACPGLVLFVNPTGMRYEYAYRPRGTDPVTGKRWGTRAVTLGNPASLSVEQARIEANRLKGSVQTGGDPLAAKKAEQVAARKARGLTLGALFADYTAALPRRPKLRGAGLPSPRHVAGELAHVGAALDAMGARGLPAGDLDAAMIRRAMVALADKPAVARGRYGALSRFCDWLIEDHHLAVNPCGQVARSRRPKAVASRAHYITLPDLARLWRAAEALAPLYRDLARLLIAIPCRRGDVASLDWKALDLDGAVWTQAQYTTKNGEPHRLHLHPLALDILQARYQAAGRPKAGLVFAAPRSGLRVNTWSKVKLALDEAAGLTGWRWHDCRRSFATALGEAGIPEAVADAVLNHRQSATRGGVMGVYQRAQRWPEQKAVTAQWGAILAAAINPEEAAAKVVPMLRPSA